MRHLENVEAQIRRNHYLRDHLHAENVVPLGLRRARDFLASGSPLTIDAASVHGLFPAITFAAQVATVLPVYGAKHSVGFCRRVRDCLGDPGKLAGLQMEFAAGTHFASRGHRVLIPKVAGNEGTFDWLLPDFGPLGLEVECKAITVDKGRRLHRKEVAGFFFYLMKACGRGLSLSKDRTVHLSITLEDRLPKSEADLKRLADEVRRSLLSDGKYQPTDLEASVHVDEIQTEQGLRNRLEVNLNKLVEQSDDDGLAIVTIRSRREDTVLRSIFQVLDESVRKQATGRRPIVLCVGLMDASAADLNGAFEIDRKRDGRTALGRFTDRFLRSESRPHVVGVSFFSRQAVLPQSPRLPERLGTVYSFPRRESPFWNEAFRGVFDQPPLDLILTGSNHGEAGGFGGHPAGPATAVRSLR